MRRLMIVVVLLVLVFEGSAFAAQGDVVFKDAMYGAVIGAVVGGAVYLIDKKDFTTKMGVGVAVGTLGGLLYGISADTKSALEINKGKVKLAMPAPVIQRDANGTTYSASLLKVRF